MQHLRTQATSAGEGWGRLVRAHAAISRELDRRLSSEHDLTINEYEVLLLLARAEDGRMRRVDIATELVLSPSGVTRMLDRLGDAGLVDKAKCDSDARVTYAVLTDHGLDRLKEAGKSHDSVIEEMVGGPLRERDLKRLAELLDRLPGVEGDETCSIADE